MTKLSMPNVSIVFCGDKTCYILFTQVLKVNLIEIAFSYSSKQNSLITISDYTFVLVERDYISAITKLTYAKQIDLRPSTQVTPSIVGKECLPILLHQ